MQNKDEANTRLLVGEQNCQNEFLPIITTFDEACESGTGKPPEQETKTIFPRIKK
jgi:hypothetical protein